MPDVLKVVAARIQATSLSATLQPSLQPQGPLFGNIIGEESTEAPEETRTVLWQNDLIQDVVAISVADLNLDVIEDADADSVNRFSGAFVVRVDPNGPVQGDVAGGTSREFAGTVISVYRRTPLEATPGSGDVFLLCLSNGMYCEDLASQFTVLKNY